MVSLFSFVLLPIGRWCHITPALKASLQLTRLGGRICEPFNFICEPFNFICEPFNFGSGYKCGYKCLVSSYEQTFKRKYIEIE